LTGATPDPRIRRVRRQPRAAILVVCASGFLAGTCSNLQNEREKLGISPRYDKTTGKLEQLTYDSDHNGKVDTWTDMAGARPVQSRIDRNEDGKIDRWEYYDEQGRLVKVGFSRKDDGKPDAWAYGTSDTLERVEVSSLGDEKKIDRWEHYAGGALLAAEEDTNHDGFPDKWETYEHGAVRSAAFDEDADGKPDRRLTYVAGTLVSIETAPDAAGRFTMKTDVK
jgi:hypothetical protein